MAQAICPHCHMKLQLPDNLAPGMMLQCSKCQSQFLPPEPEIVLQEVTKTRKKKKLRKRKDRESISIRTLILVCSLAAIVLLLITLGSMYLFQPSHAKFNEQVVASYQRFTNIMQQSLDIRRINNVQSMLQQFEKLAPELANVIDEVRNFRPPEDSKGVQSTFISLLEATQRFGNQEVPQLLKKLKSSNERSIELDLGMAFYRISNLHESLIEQQHHLAKTHGLLQIQVPTNRDSFLARMRRD